EKSAKPIDWKQLSEEEAQEKLAKLKAERALKELQLQRESGELISREDHEKTIEQAVAAVRGVLLALPRKTADQLAHLSTAEVTDRLTQLVREVLDLFAGRLQGEQ